VENDGLMQ